MNINTNFNAAPPPFMAGGLSGRSLMTRATAFNPGANRAQTSPAARAAMLDIRATADALRGAAREAMGFTGNAASPFGTMFAASQNAEVLTIAQSGRLGTFGNAEMEVEVLQLATHQRNVGTERTANARAVDSGLAAGNHQLSLTVGNQTFDIQFQVRAGDTNRDVHNRIAQAVNARNIGVTAAVETQGTGNAQTTALVLQSRETGTANANAPVFTVSGNAAGWLGANEVTQQAQNAEFRINRGGFTGAVQTARTNEVDLGFGTTATLRAEGTARITPQRDETAQINAIRNLVNHFNDLIEVAQENRVGPNGGRLERELRGMLFTNQSALNRVGISVNAHGFLDIDAERMAEAAAGGELERFAQPGGARSATGFLNRVERMADRVGRNAPNFTGAQTAMPDFDFGGMSANWNNQFTHWMNTGMLFDSMF